MVIILNTKKKVMKTKLVVALALIMGLAINGAEAQIASGRHQKAQIAQGVRRGELTRFESRRLAKEQHRIYRHTRKARLNDGHIGPRERRMLAFEKSKANRHVYHYKHNRLKRS